MPTCEADGRWTFAGCNWSGSAISAGSKFWRGTLRFFSEAGNAAARAETAAIDLQTGALLRGRFVPRAVTLRNGSLAIVRSAQGSVLIGGEPIPFSLDSSASVYERGQRTLQGMKRLLSSETSNIGLSRLTLDDFQIALIDRITGLDWQATGLHLDITRRDSGIVIDLGSQLTGDGAPSEATLTASLAEDFGRLTFTSRFLQWNPFELMERLGSSEGLSGDIRADFGLDLEFGEGALQSFGWELETGPGPVTIDSQRFDIGELEADTRYTVSDDVLVLNIERLDIEGVSLAGRVQFPETSKQFDGAKPVGGPFIANLDRLSLRRPDVFAGPVSAEAIRTEGNFDWASRTVDFANAVGTRLGKTYTAEGSLKLAEPGSVTGLPLDISLKARTDDEVSITEVLDLWPVKIVPEAREWVAESVLSGTLIDPEFDLDINSTTLRNKRMARSGMRIEARFAGTRVATNGNLPPASDLEGQLKVDGTGVSVDLVRGKIGEWQIDRSALSVVEDADEVVNLSARLGLGGSVEEGVRLLVLAGGKDPLAGRAVSGMIDADISVEGLLEEPLRPETWRYSVTGQATDIRMERVFESVDFTSPRLDLRLENDLIGVEGYGEIANSPLQFELTQRLGPDGENRAALEASAIVTPDTFNALGLPVRQFLSGDTAVDLDASGPSFSGFRTAVATLDFRDARLDTGPLGWTKPMGVSATAQIDLTRADAASQASIVFESGDTRLAGSLERDDKVGLQSLTLDRFVIPDLVDVYGVVERTGEKRLRVRLEGPYFNAESLLRSLPEFGGNEDEDGGLGAIDFTSNLNEIRLREGIAIRTAILSGTILETGLSDLSLSGRTLSDGALKFVLKDRSDMRTFSLVADDAGVLIEGMTGLDAVTGGRLQVEGRFPGEGRPGQIDLKLLDSRLKNAPLLTQILSLASLQGLSDVLSGDGILFTQIDIPLQIRDDFFVIDGARAAGPALGLTAQGRIGASNDSISLDGVLVPSFDTNSALGSIPLIGDLLVSREGEGVFAVTYSVRGTLSQARVAINPLSGMLPGILRRIFENPADPLPIETPDPVDE